VYNYNEARHRVWRKMRSASACKPIRSGPGIVRRLNILQFQVRAASCGRVYQGKRSSPANKPIRTEHAVIYGRHFVYTRSVDISNNYKHVESSLCLLRNFMSFYGTEVSFACEQEPSIDSYLKPDESSQLHHNLFVTCQISYYCSIHV
jgi:hypothetical protein